MLEHTPLISLDFYEEGFFVTYKDPDLSQNDNKISIGIASAVTAYSRIFMSNFKNNSDFKLFYTDTDSIFTDQVLPEHLVGKELGEFKLEYIFKEGVFLGPKIYAGITTDNKYICKVKGYKNSDEINFLQMKSLLIKDSSLEFFHYLNLLFYM